MTQAARQRVTFRTPNGLTLVGDAWGSPADPPVIFLPGGGQTRHAWGNTARRVGEAGGYALAMDLRGHGESGWPEPANYRLEAFVSDLACVAAELSRPPAVVGASLGGLTALLAAGGPARLTLAAVVLVDIAPRIESAGAQRIESFMRGRPDGFASLEEAAEAVAKFLPHRPPPDDLSGLEKNLRLVDGRYHWHWDPVFLTPGAGPGLDSAELLEAARKLDVPTLLVRGRISDVLSGDGVQEFLEAAPRARFVDVAEAGHMVAGDRNDRFTRAVLDFLSDVLAR